MYFKNIQLFPLPKRNHIPKHTPQQGNITRSIIHKSSFLGFKENKSNTVTNESALCLFMPRIAFRNTAPHINKSVASSSFKIFSLWISFIFCSNFGKLKQPNWLEINIELAKQEQRRRGLLERDIVTRTELWSQRLGHFSRVKCWKVLRNNFCINR